MFRIQAALPTLGSVAVDFHQESAEIVEFMGEKEQRRLRGIPHLGVAATVFTGVNHSRLEYMLLQCAVIGLVAKIHRNTERVALSNEVTLSGISKSISSGEELLKSWALLSNYGHAQYTYGVERGILQYACDEPNFSNWLLRSIRQTDLRDWARNILVNYRDQDFHFLFALLRISQLPPGDRKKSKFTQYLRNFLLPPDVLFPQNPIAQYKIERLRQLFSRIRLLSIVALDSHYSHYPVNINLNSAILGLVDHMPTEVSDSGFDRMLAATAGWLADGLYLHPQSVASQRDYELRVARQLRKRFVACKTNAGLQALIRDMAFSGFGRPSTTALTHLIRLSFTAIRSPTLASKNLYEALKQLERELATPPRSYVSVSQNPFTRAIHIDLLYKQSSATKEDIARLYVNLQKWLARSLEAEALEAIRRVLNYEERKGNKVRLTQLRRQQMRRRAERYSSLMYDIFRGMIRFILPSNLRGAITEFMPEMRRTTPILWLITDSEAEKVDNVLPILSEQINNNPHGYTPERIHELKVIRELAQKSEAPFLLVCPEKFVISNEH